MPRPIAILILVCVVIEGTLTLSAVLGFPAVRQIAYAYGGFWPYLLHGGRELFPGQAAIMFLTYGLLHGGLVHLAMNMPGLAQVGTELAQLLSMRQIALIYVASQVVAAGLQAVMAPDSVVVVGASGAIFGLAGALIGVVFVRLRRMRRSMGQLGRSVAVLVGMNVALTLMMPHIAWQAHLGGALTGLAMGLWYGREFPPAQGMRPEA